MKRETKGEADVGFLNLQISNTWLSQFTNIKYLCTTPLNAKVENEREQHQIPYLI